MRRAIITSLAAGLATALAAPAAAQTTTFDETLSNSHWYVPVPQLLAYVAPSTSFANPIPVGDQTLWAFGPASNGAFNGLLSAELSLGGIDFPSNMTISGQVAADGSVVMIFDSEDLDAPVVGLGQMKTVDGQPAMLMQMITPGSTMLTHWAYMLTYDPATFTPPAPQAIPVTLSSRQWMWTEGTPWRIVEPSLFGSTAPGTFVITNYVNGYFWGQGIGPDGSGITYTLLGSITPDGKVLYNAIADGDLISLYGDVRGDPSAAAMILSGYSTSGIDAYPSAALELVRPYEQSVAAAGLGAALPAANVLYDVAGSVTGLTGAMAPATLALNDLSGATLASAVGSTLPVLAGAGVRATADSQRMLGQVLGDRMDRDRQPGEDWTAWLRPLGGTMTQSARDPLPGYSADTAGIAAGFDRAVSPSLTIGTAFAYDRVNASGERADAPGSLSVDSYLLALYGSTAFSATAGLDVSLALGINDNTATRPIAFMGSTASADYSGTTAGASLKLHESFSLAPGFVATPALTAAFLQVTADAYRETGAGPLDLTTTYQAYQELPVGVELALAYGVAPGVEASAHGGVSYNVMDTSSPITASFAGGGDAFVTEAAEASPWLMTAGLGLSGDDGKGRSLGLYYDLQASPEGFVSQAGSLAIDLAF